MLLTRVMSITLYSIISLVLSRDGGTCVKRKDYGIIVTSNVRSELERIPIPPGELDLFNRKLKEKEEQLAQADAAIANLQVQFQQLQNDYLWINTEMQTLLDKHTQYRLLIDSQQQEHQMQLQQIQSELEKNLSLSKAVEQKYRSLEQKYEQLNIIYAQYQSVSRVQDDLWNMLNESYQQLKDDSIIFRHEKGLKLGVSEDLSAVPYIHYRVNLSQGDLKGVFLALLIEHEETHGIIGIEVIEDDEIILHTTSSISAIDANGPTLFNLPVTRIRQSKSCYIRVFARHMSHKIWIFEWKRNIGRKAVSVHPFIGYLYT